MSKSYELFYHLRRGEDPIEYLGGRRLGEEEPEIYYFDIGITV